MWGWGRREARLGLGAFDPTRRNCVVLFAIFAIVSTVSVPEVQFVQTDFFADL
jgi:hypothetical protein